MIRVYFMITLHLQFIMGISLSDHIINNRWDFVRQTQGGYVIVRDKSGREGAEYLIEGSNGSSISEQLDIYDLRKMSPHQVVSVYGSQLKDTSGPCSGSPAFRVITQNICVRFSQKFLLNIEEATYVLIQAVKGFQYLYSKVGCFGITSQMFGLNAEGQLKVWMHSILGENYPEYPKGTIIAVADQANHINQEECYMIDHIFRIVESHTDKRFYESQLRPIVQTATSFADLLTLLYEIRTRFKITTVLRVDFAKKGIKPS